MMKRLAFVLSLAFLGAAPVAHATGYNGVATFYTTIHFSDVAWSKEVKAVSAHIGVLTIRGGTGEAFWSDVLHVPLKHEGGKFVNWAVLHGSRTSDADNARGAMVQYWVTFADGSSLVTDPFLVEPREWSTFTLGDPAAGAAHERLRKVLERGTIEGTAVAVVEEGHVS